MVDSVFSVGELCHIGVAVEVGKYGGIVNDGEDSLTEEEIAVGEAQGYGLLSLALANKDGKRIGLRTAEFDDFAARGCEDEGRQGNEYGDFFHCSKCYVG